MLICSLQREGAIMKRLWTAILLSLCLTATCAIADPTVRIGAIYGKTGAAALPNNMDLNGIRLATEELNARGGLLGKHRIELVEVDNQSSALGSKAAARKAVEAGVIAVIGASWSSHSLAMAPVLQDARIPMISSGSTNPEVTLAGDFIFRVCFIDDFQGLVMAQFAFRDLGARKAVVLTNAGNKFSIGLAARFIDRFRKLGGRILWEGDYLEDASDFTAILGKVRNLTPEVVFLPGYSKDSALIIKEARKLGIQAVFLGGDGWTDVTGMYQYGGASLDGTYYSSHWYPDPGSPQNLVFMKKYEKRFGTAPDSASALGHDAMMVLADAVTRANSLDTGRIRDALAATRAFKGVTGEITFDKNRNPVNKPAVIMKFENGKSVYVKTIKP
jgi:branched-chain amino acid transport system substrate-binding protein